MTDCGSEYFKNLYEILCRIETTGENGERLDTDDALNQVVKLTLKIKESAGKVIFVGNGGSAGIASHQAVDFWKNGGVRATAFNDASLLTCVSNDYSYAQVFEKPIEMFADGLDVLFAISSSGQSENILNAVNAAQVKGCATLTFSGFRKDNPLRKKGQINFYVPSEEYGYVEIAHTTLCHYVADKLMAQNKAKAMS